MTEFNLRYTNKITGKVHEAKRVAHWSYKIKCPDTGKVTPITKTELNNGYVGDKKNRGAYLRKTNSVIRKRIPTDSKAFQAYLRGET